MYLSPVWQVYKSMQWLFLQVLSRIMGNYSSVLKKLFHFSETPGLIFSALMVDKVGRKLTLEITCTLGFIVLIPLILPQNEMVTTALLFGARMFIMATNTVVGTYAREVCMYWYLSLLLQISLLVWIRFPFFWLLCS